MPKFKALFAAAAAMLTATTAGAAAPVNPAASLSLSASVRAGGSATHTNRLGASVPTTTLISIGILAALVVIVLVATKGNNDNGTPASN